MKSAHLSDLHFGRPISREKLRALAEDIIAHRPELIVITGDITDRGRISQFRWARDFLMSLSIPFISVPGNREICIGAIWEWLFPRFAMRRYRHYFGAPDRVMICDRDSDTVFFGLNSVHAFPSWPGRIARETRYWLKEQACRFPRATKVLFLHHPVAPVIRSSSFWAHTLSDAGEIVNICSQTGITLILQGHKHRSSVIEIRIPERSARLVVSCCGAPLMSRWDPVYHMIDILPHSIAVEPRELLDGTFKSKGSYEFVFDSEGIR